MRKQRKFTNRVGIYNEVEGVTESESLHLPKAEKGLKTLDLGFETIYNYEFLEPLVSQARNDFLNDIQQNINGIDIEKINSGLRDYVNSSILFSYNLDLLKASLLNALGKDILIDSYSYSDDVTKQMVPYSYFEDISDLISINECWLIQLDSIDYYKSRAFYYTKKVLIRYIAAVEETVDNFYFYRGQGNVRYYKNDLLSNFADSISVFTGLDGQSANYFERQLLNSYTINRRVSEKFMMQNNNQRRLLLSSEFECAINNVFSSFVVSDIFVDGQYELLCLPSEDNLYITEEANDSLFAEFHVSKSERTSNKLIRKEL